MRLFPTILRRAAVLAGVLMGLLVLGYWATGNVEDHRLNIRFRVWCLTGIGWDDQLTPELMKVTPSVGRSMEGRSLEAARWWFPRLVLAQPDDAAHRYYADSIGSADLWWINDQHLWGLLVRDGYVHRMVMLKG